MGYLGDPVISLGLAMPYPIILRPTGDQPMAGLTAAQGLAAHRANLVFQPLDPIEIRPCHCGLRCVCFQDE